MTDTMTIPAEHATRDLTSGAVRVTIPSQGVSVARFTAAVSSDQGFKMKAIADIYGRYKT